MSGNLDTSLHYFLIFNPKLGQKEGTEHEKILFFYPQTISIGDQTNFVGLTEGYIVCTRQFSPEKPCEFIHTQKNTITILSPEPDIWIVMSVSNPSQPGKDAKQRDYVEDETDEFILKRVAQQVYSMWTLFNGPLLKLPQDKQPINYEQLRKRVDQFLKPYIQQMAFDQLDIFNSLDGIRFLPLNKNVYLTLISYVNSIECNFQSTIPSFKFGTLLYKDNIIWSSLNQNDTRSIYNYLTNIVKIGSDSSTGGTSWMILNNNGEPNWHTKGSKKNGFLNMIDLTSKSTLPFVYLEDKEKQTTMIIYEQKDTIILFFIDPVDIHLLKFEELSASLVSKFEFINPILDDSYTKKSFFDDQYKYIYFNQMNLAIRASIKSKSPELTKDILKILNDIHADFETSSENISETIIKTQTDRWIVAKRIDFREFYFIFDNKNTTLLEIDEEVKNLTNKYFKNLFIE
ncbi:hypothetical protein DLAC_07987 [Tieghemostelium lacteum]|uniref:CCZ1/INTU/HSP4 first Longin domain-containing protein n=1 Tax=Tieghemostelium lacteum TaxID=361077 RepID=A0A151ZAV7_TIELA|nr:hypothetical protein DLAC_07987 [Tieghemostelium lacteum]|eukprot:KYQ91083.1 hypothetical protein DLAC_07987 [Tieghemostelium lacteum]